MPLLLHLDVLELFRQNERDWNDDLRCRVELVAGSTIFQELDVYRQR
jgi:hypothetical protein